jgi:Leucine-rich repeat (LRR) protein
MQEFAESIVKHNAPRTRAAGLARHGLSIAALFCCTLAGWTCQSTAAIPLAERDTLIALYTNTHGNEWMSNGNWCLDSCPLTGTPAFNEPGTECTWAGILCDATESHVTDIVMFHNHMVGPLPDLRALQSLEVVGLDHNELTGPLPPMAGLSALKIFNVHANRISGPIPDLSGLVSLEMMRLFENQLSGPIPPLAGLPQLQLFYASSNQLSGSIPPLENLPSFVEFSANDNQLTGSIPSLDAVPSLQAFSVHGNQLTGPIPDLSNLTALSDFYVHMNGLSGSVPPVPENSQSFRASLCPNSLDTTPSANDAGWNAATGHTPWWAAPFATNLCDDLFADAFES